MSSKQGSTKRPTASSEARVRVLDAAEGLFMQRGYNAVTMQDIARALGIRQASLYYHAPGGKEELFVEIMDRSIERHRSGLAEAMASAPEALKPQLQATARWLLSQQPLNLLRMLRSDMPAIADEDAERIQAQLYLSIMAPIGRLFSDAMARGEVRPTHPDMMSGSFLSVMDGVWAAANIYRSPIPAEVMADELIEVFLHGISKTPSEAVCAACPRRGVDEPLG